MFKNLDNKKKANLFILLMVLTIIFAYMIFAPSGVINRIILTGKKSELLKQIEIEQRAKDTLEVNIRKMQEDTVEIERIAREKYGMKKPNEKIFMIESKKANQTKE